MEARREIHEMSVDELTLELTEHNERIAENLRVNAAKTILAADQLKLENIMRAINAKRAALTNEQNDRLRPLGNRANELYHQLLAKAAEETKTVADLERELTELLNLVDIRVVNPRTTLPDLLADKANIDSLAQALQAACERERRDTNSFPQLSRLFRDIYPRLTNAIDAKGRAAHTVPLVGPDEVDEEEVEAHFFATTVKEFEDKAKALNAFNHKELNEYANLAGRTLLACEKMEDSASTTKQRQLLQNDVRQQLKQLREVKAFLQDCIRLHAGSRIDPKNPDNFRYDGLLTKYRGSNLITPDKVQDQIRVFTAKIEGLKEADRYLSSIAATGATQSVYYSNLNEAVTCASFQEAKDRATAFLSNRGPIDPTALVMEASKPVIDPTAISQFRFIATEVDSNAGKQAVAIIQETNASKSYSKQTVLTPGNTIANLKKASHDEQMKFVAHLIETQLAAITTNGPIRISRNWDAKLALAAATYAKAMDYDFQPKEWLAKVKATDVADYLMKNKNEPFLLEAIARRDAKNNTVESPRFRC